MGEILPRHYITGIILFTLVIVGGVSMLSEFRAADPTFGDEEKLDQFNRTFNIMDDVTQSVGSLESGIVSTAPGDTTLSFGVLGGLINGAWQTLKLLFNSFSFMDAVFGGLFTVFGVPIWVGNLLILLVTVLLAFAIYTAIFQREI